MDEQTWINKKLDFIDRYAKAQNAASGSDVDANANVTTKNIATLQGEIVKDDMIKINRAIMDRYLRRDYGEEVADQYKQDLKEHYIYSHDETGLAPYCVAVSLYPFLLNGLKDLGGSSLPPKHADSYIGGMINLIFLLAGQYLGAVAVPEFLPYFDYFLRKDFGDDYINHLDEQVILYGNRKETLRDRIEDWFQQFVYSINQPAGSRNYQSPFVNISYYDKGYFSSIFKDFVFPDGTEPKWETTKELQKLFIKWFNQERTRSILTFPVETFNILFDKETHKYQDEESADFVADAWAHGHSFFLYNSDSADALSSCCRLKNAIDDNVFSYTLGAGGIQTGSKKVITMNLNRIVQDWYNKEKNKQTLSEYIATITRRIHKYLSAWNHWLWDLYDSNLLTVYKAGFISLDKQFLSLGVNGFIEGAEFLADKDSKYKGLETLPDNEQYKQYAKDVLETIKQINKEDKVIEHKIYELNIDGSDYVIPSKTKLSVIDTKGNISVKSIDDLILLKDDFDIDEAELVQYRVIK